LDFIYEKYQLLCIKRKIVDKNKCCFIHCSGNTLT
jgi:hypothetical protein